MAAPKAAKRSFIRRAEQQGLAQKELAERLVERRWHPKVASKDCLELEEIEEYCATGRLPDQRRMHLDRCSECRGLVAASMPSPDRLAKFLAEVKGRLARVVSRTASRS